MTTLLIEDPTILTNPPVFMEELTRYPNPARQLVGGSTVPSDDAPHLAAGQPDPLAGGGFSDSKGE